MFRSSYNLQFYFDICLLVLFNHIRFYKEKVETISSGFETVDVEFSTEISIFKSHDPPKNGLKTSSVRNSLDKLVF